MTFSHMTAQEEAGCQFSVNRWHWANKMGKTLETRSCHRSRITGLVWTSSTAKNVRGMSLLTCCCMPSMASRLSVSLYPVIMLSKPIFSRSVSCRERQIIISQMVLGNRLRKMKRQWEECSLSHGIHNPAMATTISMMMMRERITAN